MRYPGTSALVTGGGQGIGRAIVAELYANGANVVIMQRDGDAGRQTIAELQYEVAGTGQLVVAAGTVASAADFKAAFDLGESTFGEPIQMLVNNAGGGGQIVLVADVEEDFWDDIVDVNLKGTFLGLREFARRLMAANLRGSAVNISSLNWFAATDGLGPYCAAKAGVWQLTKVCASEWGPAGIRVNSVAPGTIETPKAKELHILEGLLGSEFMNRTPLCRFGTPEDVAHAVSFLLSEDAAWITGTNLGVDGGQGVRALPMYHGLMAEQERLAAAKAEQLVS